MSAWNLAQESFKKSRFSSPIIAKQAYSIVLVNFNWNLSVSCIVWKTGDNTTSSTYHLDLVLERCVDVMFRFGLVMGRSWIEKTICGTFLCQTLHVQLRKETAGAATILSFLRIKNRITSMVIDELLVGRRRIKSFKLWWGFWNRNPLLLATI